ncbi:MAG: propanoyl-CoA acyltransferase [Ignavibacteria bacterium]|jgi:acetyl-CoA C-acetyltransferase
MSKVSIVGAHNTSFGAFVKKNKETGEVTDLKSLYDLLTEAGKGAIEDSGLESKDIDAVWIGACSPSLFINQEHLAPIATEIDPAELRYKPMTRVEGACASSSVAIYNAIYAIESGRFMNVLVIGVEKMSLLDTKGTTHALACSSYWPEEGAKGMTFPGLFAEYAKGYQTQYNISDTNLRKMFSTVAALCYKNGVENPLAHFGPGSLPERLGLFTSEAILNLPDEGKGSNFIVAPPLRLHDCSLISDGAAALVLTSTDNAKSLKEKVIEIAGIGHSEERIPLSKKPNMFELVGAKHAVNMAYEEADISSKDIDLAEVHDCFTINQLLCTEAIGLSEDGKSGYEYIDGKFERDTDCPVNLSGGLKAKGHPVGATGASMHVLIYKQLIGEAIGIAPKKQPEVGVLLNVGGSAATNCATVLRRVN